MKIGLSGFYPVHPRTYMTAWRNRLNKEKTGEKEAEAATDKS